MSDPRTIARVRYPFLRELMVLIGRVWLGGLLVAGGVSSLLAPAAELAHTMQGYQVLPEVFVLPLAQALPWVELMIGLGVILGLSQRFSLPVAASLATLFWLVISQALVRQLPMESCGCFGQLFALSLRQMWAVDASLMITGWWLAWRHTPTLSLDRWVA